MRVLIYILSLMLLCSCSHESTKIERDPSSIMWSSCFDSVSKFFNRKDDSYDFLKDVILKINNTEYIKIESLSNRSETLVYEYLEQYPEFKELIKAMPHDKNKRKRYYKYLSEKIDNFHFTMADEVLRAVEKKNVNEERSAADYLEEMRLSHLKKSKNELDKINNEIGKIVEEQKLSKFYQGNFFAEVQHDSEFIYIEGVKYPYEEIGQDIIVTIPKEKAKSPAWNPLTKEQRERIMASNVSHPNIYETTLGLDGNFYLLDGNHRFHLKDFRSTIKVRISSFKTSSLNIFVDLIGEKHLASDKIKLVFTGEKTIYDVMSEEIKSKIVFTDLIMNK